MTKPDSFDAFDEPLVSIGEPIEARPKQRTKYPWELSGMSSELLGKICRIFLAEIFDSFREEAHGNNLGIDFKSDGVTFSLRYSYLTPDKRSWTCKFGKSRADHFLFFGFRNLDKPTLEFCLRIPRDSFKDRDHISIKDDKYTLKGYEEFKIDSKKFQQMIEVMDVIDKRDDSKIKELFPGIYNGRYYSLD